MIDDSPEMTSAFEYVAQEMNIPHLSATTSKAGLEILSQLEPHPHVVFLDFYLDDCSAEDLIMKYKQKFLHPSLTIILFSNLGKTAPQLNAVRNLVDHVEEKPKDLSGFEQLLKKWF